MNLNAKHQAAGQSIQDRLDTLQNRLNSLLGLIEDRGAAPEMQTVPGGSTGLLMRKEDGNYAFDAATVAEIRSVLQQAAEAAGERVARIEETVTRVAEIPAPLRGKKLTIAIVMAASGDYSDEDILAHLRVTPSVLEQVRLQPYFTRRVAEVRSILDRPSSRKALRSVPQPSPERLLQIVESA